MASNRHAEVYDSVPSQHDGKDAGVIAELAAIGKSKVWAWREVDGQEQMLAAHAALMASEQEEINKWRGWMEGKLARHWPEILRLLALDSTALLEALMHYQSPGKLAEDSQAAEKLARWGGAFLKPEKIQAVIKSARETRGVPVGVGEGYQIAEIARRMLESKRRMEKHRRALEEGGEDLPTVRVAGQVLGPVTMAVLYLEAGDPGGYGNGQAYLKVLGLNLAERSSGKYKGHPAPGAS